MSQPTADEVVREFCRAVESLDGDGAVSFLAEGAVMVKMPQLDSASDGRFDARDEVLRIVELLRRCASAVEWRITRQLASPDLVFHERSDIITWIDGSACDLPVVGVFEIEHGRITRWWDYFDAGHLNRQVGDWSTLEAKLVGMAGD